MFLSALLMMCGLISCLSMQLHDRILIFGTFMLKSLYFSCRESMLRNQFTKTFYFHLITILCHCHYVEIISFPELLLFLGIIFR